MNNVDDKKTLIVYGQKMTRWQMLKKAAFMGVVSGMTFYTQAHAANAASEVSFTSLADDAIDNMKNAGKAALGVLGIGVTIVGTFKGYSYLKQGIRRA